jgi:hypothetical protein
VVTGSVADARNAGRSAGSGDHGEYARREAVVEPIDLAVGPLVITPVPSASNDDPRVATIH